MKEEWKSIEILKSILNEMDAYLYVTDPKTDEILFINNKMNDHFGLEGKGVGKTCWKVLQSGIDKRCEFCPNHKLIENPDEKIEWEEHNTLTGRYYKNTDRLIEWVDGRMVHLQHAVDITDLKMTEKSLKRQIEQLKVVAEISQIFTDVAETKKAIFEALKKAGEFMGVSHAFISEKKGDLLVCMQEWYDESATSFVNNIREWPISSDMPYYQQLTKEGYVSVEDYKKLTHPNFKVVENCGLTAFLNTAIEVSGDMWGIVGFVNYEKPHKWSQSDIDFSKLIAGILSGVMSRGIAEEELYNTQNMISAVIEHAPMAIFWKGTDLKYKGYNNYFSRFFGKHENLIGKTDFDVMTKNDAEISKAEDEQILKTETSITIDSKVTNAKGELRWIHLKKALVKDNKGRPRFIVGIAEDITERREAENDMLKMSTIINHAPQHIAYINNEGKFDFFNPATYQVTGFSYDELINGGIEILYDKDVYADIIKDIIPKVISEGKFEFELPLRRKDGEVRTMAFSAFLLSSQDFGIGSIALDVTDRKKIELELMEAKELAEQGSKAKGEFLSRMSHEMRTPMNAIIGMTSIAQSSKDPEKKEYCLSKIYDASKHLLDVINDILDMSKIEANKFELSNEEFDLEKMLINVTDVVNYRAEEKKQELVVHINPSIPTVIIGDQLRLSQVVTNLLSNAVKFTNEGGSIRLNVERLSETDDTSELLFEVIDNGIGLTLEQQSRLFRSFEQASGGIARKYGGTGLGLVISKQIVELLGGKIWVESEEGKGSKFSFTVKVCKSKNQPKLKFMRGINREDVRILAIDDSDETREYFQHVMSELKLPCDVASDGFEALEKIEKNKENPYNIFFVDWQMPKMNGIELTRHIKKIADENSVVIMISVAEWSDIEEQAVSAGVNYFIAKPLFMSVLVSTINKCVNISEGGKHMINQSKSIKSADFSKNHLLLAEDIAVNREIIQAFLSDTGIIIDIAETGTEAFKMFKESPGKYDIILMDVHMPEMDGFEATRKIRKLNTPEAESVPILAMTANVFKEDVDRCFEAGMNDHIGKPVDMEGLIAKVSKYIKKSSSATAKAEGEPSGPVLVDWANLLPYVDVEDGLKRLMNNKKLYFSLLKNFSGRKMADELIKTIKENDHKKIMQVAHAIKGASANLALNELRDIVFSIENHAKSDISCEQMLDKLNRIITETEDAISLLLKSEGV